MSRAETLEALQAIAERLRAYLSTGRVTIRIDSPALGLELETVAIEATGEGINSILGLRSAALRQGSAPRWLLRHRRTFVMDDCLDPFDPEYAPEPYVIETYRVRSEMVSPIFIGESLAGIISVHHTEGARHWTPQELARVESDCERVRAILGSPAALP